MRRLPLRPLGLAAVLAASVAPAASGCAPARLRVDPAVAGASDAWEVEGANPRRWDAPLRVGPYATDAVRDAGTLGWSVGVLRDVEVGGSRRPYAWRLTGGGAALDAECLESGLEVRAAGGLSADVLGATKRAVLACAFRPAGAAAAPWTLELRATGRPSPAFAGVLRPAGGGEEYAVASAHALEGSPLPLGAPAGWTLARRGGTVAVVEALGAGRLWVVRGAPEPDVVAAAAIALLLFQPPGG